MNPRSTLCAAFFAVGSLPGGLDVAAARPADPAAAYMDFAGLSQALQDLARTEPKCRVDVLGASRQGRGLLTLTLAGDQKAADAHPALLIAAGLDARHKVGVETAYRVAKRLLAEHADVLDSTTIYIVPCANPDGFEFNRLLNSGHIGTMRVVDEDRDGATDEDGPKDLNGDGVITQMRRIDPPLDDPPTMMADPASPRLLKRPDAAKGERAAYTVYVEGLDQDGDGEIAEDGPGEVDLDRNFMHRWPEHETGAGPYQLSEPESAALAKFVLEHRNIVAAITYGRHDDLINTPDGRGNDISGQAPKDLDPGDVDLYKEIGKLFKEATGQERAPQNDSAGSFHAWLYAQRGIPSFATVVWGRPEASKPPAETKPADSQPGASTQPASQPDATNPAATQPGEASNEVSDGVHLGALADTALPTQMVAPVIIAQQQTPPGGRGRGRGGRGGGPPRDGAAPGGPPAPAEAAAARDKGGDDKSKPADPEAAAWLDYSDRDRNHEGFVEWKPFDHPTLGKVEIGGFVPGFQMNPPADQLDGLGEKETKFVVELLKKLPRLKALPPEVKKLAPGIYEVRFAIANDGFLPTATAIARKARSVMPTVVSLSTPLDRIVAGERVSKAYGIGGGGDRFSQHWIIRADDNSELTITVANPQLGNQTVTFKAAPTEPSEATAATKASGQ